MKKLSLKHPIHPPDTAAPARRRPTVGGTLRERMRGALTAWIRARGDCLFCHIDEQARQRGWTIETGRYGLSRTYRDRRFIAPSQPDAAIAPQPEARHD
jgi:hypothetical protein